MRKYWRFGLILAVILTVCAAGWAAAEGDWFCPNCGQKNQGRANFCGNCREPRPAAAVRMAQAVPNAWVCSGCGEICPEEDRFCMICGTGYTGRERQALRIPDQELQEISYAPANILNWSGSFSAEGQKDRVSYTAPVSGDYRLYLRQAESGFRVGLKVLDAWNYSLGNDYCSQGGGITVGLKTGQNYTVVIEQNRQFGAYAAALGVPRAPQTLNGVQRIHDSISFEDQENRYFLTARASGLYRISMEKANKGFRAHVWITDEGEYSIGNDYLTQGGGISVKLEAGKTYTVHVGYNREFDDYTLKIGTAREDVNVNGISLISDSIYFEDQANYYTFTPEKNGTWTFRLLRADEGKDSRFNVVVYDRGNYSLTNDYLTQGGQVSAKLKAGQTYRICVRQNRNLDRYYLEIIH